MANEGGSADGAEGASAAAPKRAGKKNAVAPVDPMVRSFTLLNSSGATHSRSLRWRARHPPCSGLGHDLPRAIARESAPSPDDVRDRACVVHLLMRLRPCPRAQCDMLALMITEAEARAAEADAAARRERDTAKVRDGETVEGTCACLATSAIPCAENMGVESFRAHTVTHLCLPAPPRVCAARQLRTASPGRARLADRSPSAWR